MRADLIPTPLFDAEDAKSGAAALGDLPEWQLADLYPGMDLSLIHI